MKKPLNQPIYSVRNMYGTNYGFVCQTHRKGLRTFGELSTENGKLFAPLDEWEYCAFQDWPKHAKEWAVARGFVSAQGELML